MSQSKEAKDYVAIEAEQISKDMRDLYTEFGSGKQTNEERANADTLANITGKNLKALSVMLANRALASGMLSLTGKAKLIENKDA